MKNFSTPFYVLTILWFLSCSSKKEEADGLPVSASGRYNEPHRLQFHFSPDSMWMNDPNGMVFHEGSYHLFYQYYPDSTVWGPMHWGHAVSTDLLHWEHLPIALFPDGNGYIFSGSAVYDGKNTSGLGTAEDPPLVAIFTYHDADKEKAGESDYQTQGIAYSLDQGKSWEKYPYNPVLSNPGLPDFRDPKVLWNEETENWIMVLAVGDHIAFYSSDNLLEWSFESEFGKEWGAHGGVWECPDLFPLVVAGEEESRWVLLVSINPGGLNGGSATQYFVGDFDGKSFVPTDTLTRWVDFGMDNYAGVTYANVEDRRIFIGWMSNWMYGQEVPTERWRSAMTIPRELSLQKAAGSTFLTSVPVREFRSLLRPAETLKGSQLNNTLSFEDLNFEDPAFVVEFQASKNEDWKVLIGNTQEERISVGYHAGLDSFYIDRSASGKEVFHKGFFTLHNAPRISDSEQMNVSLLVDVGSLEMFADDGLTVMSDLFFPSAPYEVISFEGLDSISIASVRSIW